MTDELALRIVRALYYQNGADWNFCNIVYPYNTVYLVLGGDGHIRAGDTVTDLQAGYAYLIPCGLLHDIWCDNHIEKIYIDVHLEQLPGFDVFESCRHVLSLPFGCEKTNAIRHLLPGGAREHLALRGELALLLSGFMTEPIPPLPAGIQKFLPILDEVHRSLSLHIRAGEIAERYGWNPSSFSRSFKQVMGYGFKSYLEKLVGERLREELILTPKSLRQLAEEYGFCDAYYLSAFFKRRFHVSPTEYRSRTQIKKQPETQFPAV